MSSEELNKMLKKILSLVLNCEKKRVGKTDGVEGEVAGKQWTQQPLSSMGAVGDRTKDEKNGSIPDPWFN